MLAVPALAQAALVVAVLLSAVSGVLMLTGALKARTADGLALPMLVLNIFTNALWVAYAVANGNYLQTATSILWTTVVAVWWGFWLTDRGKPFWWAPVGFAVWTAVLTTAAFTVVPFQTFGWIAGFVGVVSSMPQLVALWRADHLGAGFDITGWGVSAISLTAWTVYGYASAEMAIAVPDTVALAVVGAIMWRAFALNGAPVPTVVTDWDSDEEWAILENTRPIPIVD